MSYLTERSRTLAAGRRHPVPVQLPACVFRLAARMTVMPGPDGKQRRVLGMLAGIPPEMPTMLTEQMEPTSNAFMARVRRKATVIATAHELHKDSTPMQ